MDTNHNNKPSWRFSCDSPDKSYSQQPHGAKSRPAHSNKERLFRCRFPSLKYTNLVRFAAERSCHTSVLSKPFRHLQLHHLFPEPFFTSVEQSHAGSQSALSAIGGYCLPSRSTLGSHVHHSSFGLASMTFGMCWPHPHHEALSVWQYRNG